MKLDKTTTGSSNPTNSQILPVDLFRKGINEFNQTEFFECHETLETVWSNFSGPERELIQGIIQIAVGYYHLRRNNQVGALKLFKRGVERIGKYPTGTLGLDLSAFAQAVTATINEFNEPETGHKEIDSFPLIKTDWR